MLVLHWCKDGGRTDPVAPWGHGWSPVFCSAGRACPHSSSGWTWWGPQTDWCRPGVKTWQTLVKKKKEKKRAQICFNNTAEGIKLHHYIFITTETLICFWNFIQSLSSNQANINLWSWEAYLGASYSYFWSGVDVDSAVSLPADGAAHGVCDSNSESASVFAVTQSHQSVCCFSWRSPEGRVSFHYVWIQLN